MARIGIIGAMSSEVTTYCESFGAVKTGIEGIYTAHAHGHDVFICESGIGKVNAALSAQRLVDIFKVEYLINSGVAGCLTKELSTCDAVIARELVYHDFTPLDILDRNSPFTSRFRADEKLLEIAENACRELIESGESFKYIIGNVVSGDCFVNDGAKAKHLRETFDAYCTEMEGAAIAHTAIVNKIPFAVIRTASDFADENADISFDELERIAARRASYIVTKMLDGIGGKTELVKAEESDIDEICEIIRLTIAKMHEDLNGQWDEKYPTRDLFEADLERGCLYVYKVDGRVAATVCVNGDMADEYADIPWKCNENPISIHRMAIHPDFRGLGISNKLFDFAKSLDCGCIHADTYSENILMNALYIKNGFKKVGEMSFQGRPKTFNCFEWIKGN